MKKFIFIFVLFFSLFSFSIVYSSDSIGSIDGSNKLTRICKDTACTDYGNINWKPTLNASTTGALAVSITDSGLVGHLWGDEIGWVNLDETAGGVDINPDTGELSGYGFASTGSWVNFDPTGTGVTLVDNGGGSNFSGYAWVSGPNGGWMKFDCALAATCIKTDWRTASNRLSGGGGSGEEPPPPSPPSPDPDPIPPPPEEPPEDDTPLPPSGGGDEESPGGEEPDSGDKGSGSPSDDGGSNGGGGGSSPDEKSIIEEFVSIFSPEKITETIQTVTASAREITEDPIVETIENAAIVIPAAISVIALSSSLLSGVPLLNYLFYLFVALMQILGMKRKPKPWGIVYDSYTKRPLPFARVEVLNADSRKLESVVADSSGRYGFLVSEQLAKEGNVQLRAYQNNYVFPSTMEPSLTEQTLYPNIYRGGSISSMQSATNFDLPMDPVNKSTEMSPPHNLHFGVSSVMLNKVLSHIASALFVVGAVLGVVNVLLKPNWINFAVLGVVALTFVLRKSGFKLKPFGLTKDVETNQSMPFGFVALHDEAGARVNFTVSDDQGRYFLLAPKGKYIIRAYTPSHIIPTRTKEVPISAKEGWVSKEITL